MKKINFINTNDIVLLLTIFEKIIMKKTFFIVLMLILCDSVWPQTIKNITFCYDQENFNLSRQSDGSFLNYIDC